ncbi:ExbD/TolR family protein [Acidihalobacter prosperus]
MKRRYFERNEPRLNIIPMIDIMMFLLIFFVLAVLHMIPNTGVKLHLPSASTATVLQKKNHVVSIVKSNQLRYEQHLLTLSQLKSQLEKLQNKTHQTVVLASDKTVQVAELMKVMNTIRSVGITRIGIATKRPGKS